MPYRGGRKSSSPLLRCLAMAGSDIDNFECPRCGSHDRERHLLLYLQACNVLSGLAGSCVLHVAPERGLAAVIEALKPARYVKCDLFPQHPDVERVDVTDMQFADCTFDLLIANHVLEHVADDRLAISEVHRVLKPGGLAVLQTPYSQKLHSTWSDPGVDNDLSRWHAYGQEDHVRLYGRDVFERFAGSGLECLVQTHAQLLPDIDALRHGVNAVEPFFLFRRSL